jgi:hypothetical protein
MTQTIRDRIFNPRQIGIHFQVMGSETGENAGI